MWTAESRGREQCNNDWNEINLVFLPDGDSVDGVTRSASDPYTGVIEVARSFGKAIEPKLMQWIYNSSHPHLQMDPPLSTQGTQSR